MQPPQTADAELNTWKEIAKYLGKSVRTAQEWEQKRGLLTAYNDAKLNGGTAGGSSGSGEYQNWY